jgi:hypothetical protein
MSQAHVEKFYDILSNDAALLESLVAGTESSDEFLTRAVAAGKKQGLDFTVDEVSAYQVTRQADMADGELTDKELEGVAGGVHLHGHGHHGHKHKHHHVATHIATHHHTHHHKPHGHHGHHLHKHHP